MKWYKFADKNFRENVDLTIYTDDITKIVNMVRPDTSVTVRPYGFATDPQLTKRESIAVSKELRSGVLAEYTYYRPSLFNGYNE